MIGGRCGLLLGDTRASKIAINARYESFILYLFDMNFDEYEYKFKKKDRIKIKDF